MQITGEHNDKVWFLIQDNWVFEAETVDNEGEPTNNIKGTPLSQIKSINIEFDNEDAMNKAMGQLQDAGQKNVNQTIKTCANFYIEKISKSSGCQCNNQSPEETQEDLNNIFCDINNLFERVNTLENNPEPKPKSKSKRNK